MPAVAKIFRRPGPILEVNLKQAEVPDTCEVLFNKRGTAPGMMFRKAAPNPSEGGALEPDSSGVNYGYLTAHQDSYSLLKKFVKEHRSSPTEAEKVMWGLLRGKRLGGCKFRRQHIVNLYIADFIAGTMANFSIDL